MGANFGAGLVGSLPADLTEEEQLEVVTQFVNESGSYATFHEVIGDRVSVWVRDWDVDSERHQQSWLSDKEAAPILEYSKKNGGSAPYSWFEYLDGWSILISGWDMYWYSCEVEVPHLGIEKFYFRLYEDFYKAVEKIIQQIEQDDEWEQSSRTKAEVIEFHQSLVEDAKNAERHKMIYVIGD